MWSSICATLYYIEDTGGGGLRTAVLSLLLAFTLILAFSEKSQAWDFVKKQLFPEDMLNRPNEVYSVYEFDDVIFTRENFYNKDAGTRQYRRYKSAPQKNLKFEVFSPSEGEPAPETKIIEKDGRAVTEISIKQKPEPETE